MAQARPATAARAPARAPARTAARVAPAAKTGRTFYRGAEGARRANEEIQKNKERQEQRKAQQGMPFRFRIPADGEPREVVILDEAPDFFQYEHGLQGPEGYWNVFTGCIKEHDHCPVCEKGRDSYYALYLSVLDLTPYTTRNGDEIPFSRKLMVVKGTQQKKFMRWHQEHGSLRGAILRCIRDGDKDPSIGSDIEIVEFMEEDDLQTYVREWTDRENKKRVENCFEVLDYEKLFEEPTAESLRKLVGGAPTPGSRESNSRALGTRPAARDRDGWDDPEAEAPYEDGVETAEEAPAPRRAAAPARAPARAPSRTAGVARRAAAPPPEDDTVVDDVDGVDAGDGVDDVVDEAPPPRTARAPARTATRPVTRRAAEPDSDDVGAGDEVPQSRVARPAARPAPRAAAAPPSRRVARTAPAEDDQAVEEDAPTPRRVSFRGRR